MHLTYCSNVHPGESGEDILRMLKGPVAAVRDAVGVPLDLGLRLGADAARYFASAEARRALRETLDAASITVQTLNGFPYGAFHGTPVKEQVYAPDWSTEARHAYTRELIDILAATLPDGTSGSISTMPVTFKPWADEALVAQAAAQLVEIAAYAEGLAQQSGVDIAIALEPEPCCYLETIDETISFFETHVLTAANIGRFATATGATDAEQRLRHRLGVCYDVCHGAVEFEQPSAAMATLATVGLRIPKIQLSSALKLRNIDGAARERLRTLSEPTYLHQVVAKGDDGLRRYADIQDALDDAAAPIDEWRIHFHVPVFSEGFDGFDSTQSDLIDAIDAQKRHGYATHLEVETYTWGVLPESERAADMAVAIARELSWARERLAA